MAQGNGLIIAKGIIHMRTITLGLSALAFAAIAAPAFAEDAPASDFTVTGGATVVTDYRFRGISQTNEKFAVQGTLGVSHASGLYVGVWGSSIDDYVAAGSDQEIDIYGGYKHSFGAATVDVGVLYYYYPGSGGVNTDFIEPYASLLISFSNSSVERLPVPRRRRRSTSARPRFDGFEDLTRRNPLAVATNSTSVLGKSPNRSRKVWGMVT